MRTYGVSQWGVAHEVHPASVNKARCGKPLWGDTTTTDRALAEYAASLRGRPPIEACGACSREEPPADIS